MKVLLLNDAATPSGGAEIMTIALRDELRSRGHDARIFASSAEYGQQASVADYSCFGTTAGLRTLNRVFNVSAYRQLSMVLKTFEPDVVHVRMFFTQLSPSILPILRSVPSLYHASWYESVCPNGLKLLPDGSDCSSPAGVACRKNGCLSRRAWAPLMVQRELWKRWRTAFDVFVANSDAVRSKLIEDGIERVEVVWNGVPERPERPPLRAPPTAAYAGRLSWEKGVTVLVEAFRHVVARIPDARLLIAGDGPQRQALETLAEELEIRPNVEFMGHIPRHEMEQRIERAWVHVVPSQVMEPFGIAAAEAMMRGTAVVASDTGGLPEIVDHEQTGLLVPPRDVNALTSALVRILADGSLAEEMGRAGRDRALTHLSLSACVDKFLMLYESICSPRLGKTEDGHEELITARDSRP